MCVAASAAAALRRAATSDDGVRVRDGARSRVRARWSTPTRSSSVSGATDGERGRGSGLWTISIGSSGWLVFAVLDSKPIGSRGWLVFV